MSLDNLPENPQVAVSKLYAFGFSPWKRGFVRRFLQQPISFVYFSWQVPHNARLLLWGSRPLPYGIASTVQPIRLEDGFLRSVGLGADLVQPMSWVIDQTGMYYDATRPSDLENILNTTQFDDQLLERTHKLCERLVGAGLTKYNVGTGLWQRPDNKRRILLVVGQVESDASIKLGAGDIQTNHALLHAVREANPKAYVVYKPHPDVVAGLRSRGQLNADKLCDEVVLDVPMHVLLTQIDEMHVMTSLAGFEALLRKKQVFCYGQPFYAGWGLTHDRVPHPRRTRILSLDELAAGALILYPTYISRITHQLITPEIALDELLTWRDKHEPQSSIIRKIFRRLLRRP